MSSSPEGALLRGSDASAAPVARIGADLRTNRYLRAGSPDARLVDPRLERAFDEVAQRVRDEARAEGYATGWAEGHAAATAAVQAEARAAEERRRRSEEARERDARTAAAVLAAAAAGLERRAVAPADELRDSVLAAALELTEVLLGRELAVATDPGLDAVRRALDLVPHGRPVTVRVAPGDAAAVRDALATGSDGRDVAVVADPAVEPGGAVAECDATRVDAQLGPALARLREVLAP